MERELNININMGEVQTGAIMLNNFINNLEMVLKDNSEEGNLASNLQALKSNPRLKGAISVKGIIFCDHFCFSLQKIRIKNCYQKLSF
jgi:hypothetical protein